MKDFYRILNYVKPYYGFALLNILFNLLTVVFSLVSLTMIIPFLGILFGEIDNIQSPSSNDFISLKDHLYYQIKEIINSMRQIDALMFICLLILTTFYSF